MKEHEYSTYKIVFSIELYEKRLTIYNTQSIYFQNSKTSRGFNILFSQNI